MIILFGAAGSGKSLQGQRLAERHGWRWLSVGELLRQQHSAELDAKMKTGELVDDQFVVEMMQKAMNEAIAAGQGAVLDGYPRNVWQADWMVQHNEFANVEAVIVLDVSHNELWRRLEARGRADDTREAIEKRWAVFDEMNGQICERITALGIPIIHVDGEGEKENITIRIEKALTEAGVKY